MITCNLSNSDSESGTYSSAKFFQSSSLMDGLVWLRAAIKCDWLIARLFLTGPGWWRESSSWNKHKVNSGLWWEKPNPFFRRPNIPFLLRLLKIVSKQDAHNHLISVPLSLLYRAHSLTEVSIKKGRTIFTTITGVGGDQPYSTLAPVSASDDTDLCPQLLSLFLGEFWVTLLRGCSQHGRSWKRLLSPRNSRKLLRHGAWCRQALWALRG